MSSSTPGVEPPPAIEPVAPPAEDDKQPECRICKDYGTPEEPLYHPCKCNGSMKYVHQSCLMHWLQTTESKICDLCRTTLTFSKVYDPNMPETIPTSLFLRRAGRHVVRFALFWARASLVATVWLCWLPWGVRWMWRAWFWVSDGGWWAIPHNAYLNSRPPDTINSSSSNATSSSTGRGILAFLMSPSLSPLMSPINGNATTVETAPTGPTLLSNYYPDGIFFKTNPFANLTPLPMLNRLIVDILEGQLLAALIVTSFILVFLIREWVVQQQPAIVIDAQGQADVQLLNERPREQPAAEEPAQVQQENTAPQAAAEDDAVPVLVPEEVMQRPQENNDDRGSDDEEARPTEEQDRQGRPHRIIAVPRRRRLLRLPVREEGQADENLAVASGSENERDPSTENSGGEGSGFQRPQITREHTSRILNVGRDVEERRTPGFEGFESGAKFDFGPISSGFGSGAPSTPPTAKPPVWGGQSSEDPEAFTTRTSAIWGTKTEDGEPSTSQVRRNSIGHAPTSQSLPTGEPSKLGPEKQEDLITSASSSVSTGSFEKISPPNEQTTLYSRPSSGENKENIPPGQEEQSDDGPSDWSTVAQSGDSTLAIDERDQSESQVDRSPGDDQSVPHEQGHTVHVEEIPVEENRGLDPIPDDPRHQHGLNDPMNRDRLREAIRAIALERGIDEASLQAAVNHAARNQLPREPLNLPPRAPAVQAEPAVQEAAPETAQESAPEPAQAAPAAAEPAQAQAAAAALAQGAGAVVAPAPARGAGQALWDWFVGDDEDLPPVDPNRQEERDDEEDAAADARVGNDIIAPEIAGAIADEDNGDDLEGVMELVGMRGPMANLLQNAAICSLVIAATVAVGIMLPYVTGKSVMMVMAHPVLFFVRLPWTFVSFWAEFLVDGAVMLIFSGLLGLLQIAAFFLRPLVYVIPGFRSLHLLGNNPVTAILQSWAQDGKRRVFGKFVNLETMYLAMRRYPPSTVPPLSLVAKDSWGRFTKTIVTASNNPSVGKYLAIDRESVKVMGVAAPNPMPYISSLLEKNLGFSLTSNFTEVAEKGILAANTDNVIQTYRWSSWDRIAVCLLGYAFFTVAGAIFVRTRKRGAERGPTERFMVEFFQQCGGVMKVVLIIGIEMFVFPLYCGMLLDMAMLPLFESATVAGRMRFTMDFLFTSVFVHWFVGTCYMFHFALFVSMCRKIMRNGVLYFIRDPDDPDFHPVRDVLDRPVITQLRKIAFSGFIYGVLVLMCMGAVIWGLFYGTTDVLPIHWSSNEPVLEFPVDLLFYNFLMPVAVKYFKPAESLTSLYTWWFQTCARALRLNSFMFGERRLDEEGYHVRTTIRDFLLFTRATPEDIETPVTAETPSDEYKGKSVYFRRTGGFVRAPATDSIRRVRGTAVFVPVTHDDKRLDGKPDPPEGSEAAELKYKVVYIPPHFWIRIGIVVLGLWTFAAVTGVGVTIGPLLIGRRLLRSIVPQAVKLNDIYAFSVGLYVVGGIFWSIAKLVNLLTYLRSPSTASEEATEPIPSVIKDVLLRTAKVSYVFTAFAIVLPTLVALMIEFYIIIPMHTYFSPSPSERHVIHFVQDWTLGVLYLKMMARVLLLDAESPWARALRGIVARGYFNPDVKLATKFFIAPAAGVMIAALVAPLSVGWACAKVLGVEKGDLKEVMVYRYSYPALFAAGVVVLAGWGVVLGTRRWRRKVRDEVYLVGEVLHNHGEKTAVSTSVVAVKREGVEIERAPAPVAEGAAAVDAVAEVEAGRMVRFVDDAEVIGRAAGVGADLDMLE